MVILFKKNKKNSNLKQKRKRSKFEIHEVLPNLEKIGEEIDLKF